MVKCRYCNDTHIINQVDICDHCEIGNVTWNVKMTKIECPSMAAGRYFDMQEEPEVCPTCGHPNANEDGDWLCAEQPGWCSVACYAMYDEDARKEAENEAKMYEEILKCEEEAVKYWAEQNIKK